MEERGGERKREEERAEEVGRGGNGRKEKKKRFAFPSSVVTCDQIETTVQSVKFSENLYSDFKKQ